MTYMDLQAMRHYVFQVRKIIYETGNCIVIRCNNCDCDYICELTNCLLKFIQHELNKYDAKGELKDDNN